MPSTQVSCFCLERSHNFPCFSFIINTPIEVFLVAFDIFELISFYQSFVQKIFLHSFNIPDGRKCLITTEKLQDFFQKFFYSVEHSCYVQHFMNLSFLFKPESLLLFSSHFPNTKLLILPLWFSINIVGKTFSMAFFHREFRGLN